MPTQDPRIQEVLDIVPPLLASLASMDEQDLARLLVPRGPADAVVGLFGPDAMALLLGLHIPAEEVRGSRVQVFEQEAKLELVRPVEADEPWLRPCTLTLRRYRGRWRVWSVLPVPLDKSIADDVETDEVTVEHLEGSRQLELLPGAAQDEVERLFLAQMQAQEFNFLEQASAVRVWRDFVRKSDAAVAQPSAWAAAVEYVIVLMEFRKGSQGAIGRRYVVSTATVAARYKSIVDALKLYQYDERYSLRPSPVRAFDLAAEALGTPSRRVRMPLGGGRGKGFFGPR